MQLIDPMLLIPLLVVVVTIVCVTIVCVTAIVRADRAKVEGVVHALPELVAALLRFRRRRR
ncbi:hypothetical protein ACIRD8_37165 [Streptomyces sp. NPDC102451]|uniref:hypothetical protein n=1 Tax=Streptomyces sp. NPDC102451 TaxID=3366177 RepID=UPI00380DC96F